jgi:potassium-transporting ATPase KdpC subunit
MRKDITTSAIGIVVLTLLLGILYPLFITGVSQVAFPGNANGQKIYLHGQLVGSKIIGQSFEYQVVKNGKPLVTKTKGPLLLPDLKYFQTRPSATGEPYISGGTPDNAAGSSFSNLGPNSVATEQTLAGNIAAYISLDKSPSGTPYYPGGLTAAKIPVDAVNSSASGIDPHISIANADIQAYRVASVRHLSIAQVDQLISKYTAGRGLGFSGEPGVNVLELNLALDRMTQGR